MSRFAPVVAVLLSAVPMSTTEPPFYSLGPDESVSRCAVLDDTLAIGIGIRGRFDQSMEPSDTKDYAAVIVMGRDRTAIRTPSAPGVIRAVTVTPLGFVVGRVVHNRNAQSMTEFMLVGREGKLTAMPPLSIDLVGLWTNGNGAVFAYGTRAVFRLGPAGQAWEEVRLDPAVSAEAVRRIVALKNGMTLVVTDRVLKGFASLQQPPVFVRDLKTYPNPIKAYGDDQWWIATANDTLGRLSRVGEDGGVREVASWRSVHVQDVLFSATKVIVITSDEGGNVHRSSYYTVDRSGAGPTQGPFSLPLDITTACIWGDSIVSGGAANQVFKTRIQP